MQEQLLLSLVEKAPDDDATENVWQAQSIEQRVEALAVLGRLIARAAVADAAIVAGEDPNHE
jgi:hypothetical protein